MLIGFTALLEQLQLKVPAPAVRSEIVQGARRTRIEGDRVYEQYPPSYAREDTPFEHLRFGLRYEPGYGRCSKGDRKRRKASRRDASYWDSGIHRSRPSARDSIALRRRVSRVEVSLQTGSTQELREHVFCRRGDGAFVTDPVRDDDCTRRRCGKKN